MALLAVLLAGPTCAPVGPLAGYEDAVACVIVIDDAWSMLYQDADGETLLARACAAAGSLVDSAARWPHCW